MLSVVLPESGAGGHPVRDEPGPQSPGGRARTEVPFLFVGPRERGTLADEARQAFDERFGRGRDALRRLSPTLPLLAKLLG